MKEQLINTMMTVKGIDREAAIKAIMIAADQWDNERAAIKAAKEGN